MGILNLHKFLERTSTKNNLSNLRGQVVGVDAMCWLHRGSIASAWELLTGRDTDKFLRFFVKMLVLCNMCGVKPIIVFDGASLPAKAKEETERRERRAANTSKAKEEIESKKISSFGQVDPKLRSMIVQSVSISAEMITRTMSVLRRLNVDFVVAPYEADAQLAFMYKQGIISGVVSEDSDLIAFGCHRLLSKMDINGDFMDVRLDWAFRGPESAIVSKPDNVGELGKLEKWTESMFVDLCILSGSDYKFGKIAGIGIKKAFQLLNRFRSIDRVIRETANLKKWSKEETVQFVKEFAFAKIAFLRHRVFDIVKCECVTITGEGELVDEKDHQVEDIIGPEIEAGLARLIMPGEIEAKSLEKRFFLERLPPGVLGVYNASMKPKGEDLDVKPEYAYEKKNGVSAYETLEMQIVADFEKHKCGKEEANLIVETKKNAYLSKLQGMILNSSVAPAAPLPGLVTDEEFGNIDELLLMEEGVVGSADDDTIDLCDDEDDEERKGPAFTQTQTQSQPTSSRAEAVPVRKSMVKNPFAKQNDQENKRARANSLGASTTGFASAMPQFVAEVKKPSIFASSTQTTVIDVMNHRRLSEATNAERRTSFVSSRDIVKEQTAASKFFGKKK